MHKLGFITLLLILFSVSAQSAEINNMQTSTDEKVIKMPMLKEPMSKEPMFKEPWLSTGKTHQYLGLGALALGALTAIAPKPSEHDYKDSAHYNLAMGATYLGGAALGTGFIFHYKDLSFNKMFRNPDNLHAILATVGTLGFLLAVDVAPDESHATPGIIGLVGMASAVKITW